MEDRSITTRLERLEKRNRRLVAACCSAFGVAAVALLMSFSPVCKTVWAERFVLKDSSGKERARLTAYETGGTPKLALYDAAGKSLATLSIGEDGNAFLALAGKTGETIRLTPERTARKSTGRSSDAKTEKRTSAEQDSTAGVSR